MKFALSCLSSASFTFFPEETSLTMSLLSSICVFRQVLKYTGWFLFSFLYEKQEVSKIKHLLSSTRSPQCHRIFDATFLSNGSTCSICSVSKCSLLYFWHLSSTDLRKIEFIYWCLLWYVCVTIKAENRNRYIIWIADFLLPKNLYIYNLIRNSIMLNCFTHTNSCTRFKLY